MKEYWLTRCRLPSTRRLLYIMLFFESLATTLAISGAVSRGQSPFTHFAEKGFITTISWMQLFIAAIASWKIHQIAKHSLNSRLAKSSLLWLVISLGLVFLAMGWKSQYSRTSRFLSTRSVTYWRNKYYRFSRWFNDWGVFINFLSLHFVSMAGNTTV